MAGLAVTPIKIEYWRHRAQQIRREIKTLESERRKPLRMSGPDSPTEIADVAIEKIRELRAEFKDIQFYLLRATFSDPS